MINFIFLRSDGNEATLPIIYSMFEFTKPEQEQLTQARRAFNQEAADKEGKIKGKKMFGKLFAKKPGDKPPSRTEQSFGSGAGNTHTS